MINIPRPDAVLNDLASILPIVYEGLERGTFKALDYFDQLPEEYRRPIDPHLAAYLTRFHTRLKLNQEGHNAENGEDCQDYTLSYVPNCGLYVAYKQYKIKIFKSKNGEVPSPGNSLSKQRYYEQMQLFSHIDGAETYLNLILLWEVNPPYSLKSLSIACPQSGGNTRNSVIMHWYQPVPAVYLHGIISPSSNSPSTPIQAQEIEDLPMSLNREIEIETDNRA